MRAGQDDWHAYLPGPSKWSQELALVVRRGEYVYFGHNENWLLLMSMKEGDLMPVQNGGAVQARLAVNRITGDVVHPAPGVRIGEWQADMLGKGEQYREEMERLRTAPFREEEWEHLGTMRGKPKEV